MWMSATLLLSANVFSRVLIELRTDIKSYKSYDYFCIKNNKLGPVGIKSFFNLSFKSFQCKMWVTAKKINHTQIIMPL